MVVTLSLAKGCYERPLHNFFKHPYCRKPFQQRSAVSFNKIAIRSFTGVSSRSRQKGFSYFPRMNEASFGKATWRRLKRNKGAIAGLVLIGIALFVALFGYFLAP